MSGTFALGTIGELRPRTGWRRTMPFASVAAVAGVVALLSIVPLGFILAVLVETGWRTSAALVFRPRVGELLVNTALLELIALPIAAVVALAFAWLTERSDLPVRHAWGWLAAAPLCIPAFVQGYAWISLFPTMHGLWPAILVSVLAYLPFLYLPLAAQLRRLDPALEIAAAALGQGPWTVFFRVVLPQLRLALCGGGLLVGLHLLAEYGLFALVRYDTFTTAIVDQFQSAFNGPAANMLAIVLVVSCVGLMWLEALIRGEERYARIGAGVPAKAAPRRLGAFRVVALVFVAVIVALSIGVPALTLGRWLGSGGIDIWWRPELGRALLQTMVYALAGGVLTTLAALPMAWLSVRAPGRLSRVLEQAHLYVGSLPGVVVALALATVAVRYIFPLYQTAATLLLAYVLLFLPRALVGLRASIAQVPIELERAAVSLGRTPLRAVIEVTLRLAAPGIAAGIALCSLGIANELTATLMLSPNGTTTLATRFWELTSEIDYVAAAPYAALMIVLSVPLMVVLNAQSRKVAGQ